MTQALLPTHEQVLDFWFVGPGPRLEWFRKDAGFDEEIRARFGGLHAAASGRRLEHWRGSMRPMLALVIVLDQFSRNLHRNDPRAFAQDAHALECAKQAVERGDAAAMPPLWRQFLYLPFEHSEDLADQERGVELMRALDGFEETRGVSEWAVKHRDIVARFGRFPHRNAALGRVSTPEELEFLKQPGSGF